MTKSVEIYIKKSIVINMKKKYIMLEQSWTIHLKHYRYINEQIYA